ncbi:MAG: hypothetical protein CMK89_22735 [Pseudomonadales bacterium]|nr:hypothetical protein [Pseudomonadales bacterium]
MPEPKPKHPVIRFIAYLAIAGGITILLLSLFLLHATITKQGWLAADLIEVAGAHYYQVGEKRYRVKHPPQSDHPINKVYFNPEHPEQYVPSLPSYWWHLYLCMAGLIVLYAGLHLLRERDRNLQSLGFE